MHPFETQSKLLTKKETVSDCNKMMLVDWNLYCEVKTLFPVSHA